MTKLLEVRNLTLHFDGLLAVDNFAMSGSNGSIIGLIGPNGAGKTTVFNIITGFLKADIGKVFFKGEDISALEPHHMSHTGIARTFQELRLINRLSVLDNVILSRPNQKGETLLSALIFRQKMVDQEISNRKRASEILEFVGLKEKQDDLANDLSYGQRKLLSLACCLSTGAELLLLDEPFSGLHPSRIEQILVLLKKLAKKGKMIFLIEHNIEVIREISDQVIVMDQGLRIAEGAPSKILNDQNILEAYLG